MKRIKKKKLRILVITSAIKQSWKKFSRLIPQAKINRLSETSNNGLQAHCYMMMS